MKKLLSLLIVSLSFTALASDSWPVKTMVIGASVVGATVGWMAHTHYQKKQRPLLSDLTYGDMHGCNRFMREKMDTAFAQNSDLSTVDDKGRTALHHLFLFQELRAFTAGENPVKVNMRPADKFSENLAKNDQPLEYFCHAYVTTRNQFREYFVEKLLTHHAPVNARDIFGNTPLHYAVQNFHENMHLSTYAIDLLFEHNADIEVTTNRGTSIRSTVENNAVHKDRLLDMLDDECVYRAEKLFVPELAQRLPPELVGIVREYHTFVPRLRYFALNTPEAHIVCPYDMAERQFIPGKKSKKIKNTGNQA